VRGLQKQDLFLNLQQRGKALRNSGFDQVFSPTV